jgi:carbamate kinase
VDFVDATGNDAFIAEPADLLAAVAGSAGTRIFKDASK